MPLHGYTTDRRPPTNLDHLLAHPYSLWISAWQVLAGSVVVAATLFDISVSQSVQRLPQWLMAAIACLLIVGGASVIRGLLNDDDDLMVGWRIERTGLVLSATAWATYSIVLAVTFPGSLLAWTSGLALTFAHLFRLRATILEERRVRRRIAEHKPT